MKFAPDSVLEGSGFELLVPVTWLGASGSLPRISLDLGLFLLFLLCLIFERAGGPLGFERLRLTLLLELLRLLAHEFVVAPALHLRVEHFQGSAAGVDLVVMGEIGETFEDAEQLLVPRAAPDLHIAGAALRAEWPEACQLVATLRGRRYGEGTKRAHQMLRLALAGLPRILAEPDLGAEGET